MIKDRIREDMKAAMRSHEAARLSTFRANASPRSSSVKWMNESKPTTRS